MSAIETVSSIRDVAIDGGSAPVALSERGEGRPFLLLHGGGGPQTVTRFADLLAAERPARVITPTHPGFAGTPRPNSLNSVRKLASLYSELLNELDVADITVIGNSIGGWVAAEMALLDVSRTSGFILVDAVAIEVQGHPIVDFFSLTPRQIAEHSYYDPDKFGIDPATLSPEALKAMADNRSTLSIYGGTTMNDPTLATRLANVNANAGDLGRQRQHRYAGLRPSVGEGDPRSGVQAAAKTGHMPQLETPEQLLDAIWAFAETHPAVPPH